MDCKRYIFELTSGRLAEADLGTKAQARLHRMMCSHCRAFTHNDATLSQVLDGWRERSVRGDEDAPTDRSPR